MMMKLLALSLAALSLSAAEISDYDLTAAFPADLGPEQIEVSGYPQEQQENYQKLLQTCGQCHTPARALNSPLRERKDWKRFLARMHERTKSIQGTEIAKADADAILSFLAYDGLKRKIERKGEFEAQQKILGDKFKLVVAEKKRRKQAEDKGKVKPYEDRQRIVPHGGS